MAWSANGRWIPDQQGQTPPIMMPGANSTTSAPAPTGVMPTNPAAVPEAAPVTQQAQSLTATGLLARPVRPTTKGNKPDDQPRVSRRADQPGATPPTTPPAANPQANPQALLGRPARTPATRTNASANGGSTTGAPIVPGAPAIGPQPAGADASVAHQLTGLLASNSPYIEQARLAGERIAHRRGLLNSSIAAGNSEAAAIAAAAPIASQDASQIFQRNQSVLDSWNQLRNTTTIQAQSDNAAMARQGAADKASFDRLNAQLSNAITLQGMGDSSAMQRLVAQGDIEKAIAEMSNATNLSQTQINANVALMSNYMSALATLAQNPDIPADARNSYMAEFLRVSQSTQGLVNALSGTTVTWPTIPPTPAPGTPPATPPAATPPAAIPPPAIPPAARLPLAGGGLLRQDGVRLQ